MGRARPKQVVKNRILVQQTGRCAYCNAGLDDQQIEWDHFIPYVYLQNNPDDNWVASCQLCNRAKSSRIFATEADLTAFCTEMVSRHGSFGEGWPEGLSFADLRHSGADL